MQNQHTHRIELTEAQLSAMAGALEFASRFCAGEILLKTLPTPLLEHVSSNWSKSRLPQVIPVIESDLHILKRRLFPELLPDQSRLQGLHPGDVLGQYTDILYEVSMSIRDHLIAESSKKILLDMHPDEAAAYLARRSNYHRYTHETKPLIEKL